MHAIVGQLSTYGVFVDVKTGCFVFAESSRADGSQFFESQ